MPKIPVLSALLLSLSTACLTLGAARHEASLPSLDVEAWSRWREIEGERLSLAGDWIVYSLARPDGGDGVLIARPTREGGAETVVERGAGGRFDAAAEWLVCRVEPPVADKHAAELEEKKEDERPKTGLALVSLASGERTDVERVKSFALPEKAGRHVAWLHEKPAKKEKGEKEGEGAEESASATAEEGAPAAGSEGAPAAASEATTTGEAAPRPTGEIASATTGEAEEKTSSTSSEEEKEAEEEKNLSRAEKRKRKAKAEGTELVVRDLTAGTERRFADVQHYVFDEQGQRLAFVVSTKKGESDGLFLLELDGDHEPLALLEGKGNYGVPAFSEDGRRLACLSNVADYVADTPRWSLYGWEQGEERARLFVGTEDERLSTDWSVSEHGRVWFSESGGRLFFGTAPSPRPEPEPIPKDDEVVVDIWSWTDARIQPQQLVERTEDLERSYLAVWHCDRDEWVQLGSERIPTVRVPREGECPRAIGTSNLPYRKSVSWDSPGRSDVWSIDVETGATRELLVGRRGSYALSPGGKWVYGWDPEAATWIAVAAEGGRARHLSAGLPHSVVDHRNDRPMFGRSYGRAGWTDEDERLVIYDRFDLWALDPEGRATPRCLTDGRGREQSIELRWVDLDREEEWMGAGPWLLAALDIESRDAGFWQLDPTSARTRELVLGPWRFSNPVRADEGDVVRLTRETYRDFPDLWVASEELSDLHRVSDANPQGREYRWGTAELVDWTSTTGERLEGLLYKPPGFDPEQQYPLMVYFYERNSDNLHQHHSPIPSRSTIRFPYYTSRGYLVFVPDIHYQEGYPGRSAEQAVLPGVTALVDRGFVDPERIGVQGHSWGGYQIAWLVTQSPLFAAAVAGAPVSNMTSAYGGVRWASGLSRMFQYERTQSRIGDTLWDRTQHYVQNSPLFFLEEVETPLLILHNDEDGAVPWYQGIELFLGLRRLEKPAWLLNYNGEAHGLRKHANRRDYAIRMAQFFDHYLLGEPAPQWLTEGLPATEKGRTLALEKQAALPRDTSSKSNLPSSLPPTRNLPHRRP